MKNIYTAVLIAILGVGLLMMGCGPSIEGDYVSNCASTEDTDPGNPYPNTFYYDTTYTDTQRITAWHVFAVENPQADPPTLGNCAPSEATYRIDAVYDYAIVNDDTAIWDVDYTARETTMTVLSEASLVIFNVLSVCEIGDWVLNEPRDIMGKDCSVPPQDPNITPDVGEVVLGIVKLNSDATPVTLETSATTGVGDPRPSELSPWVIHVQQ